MALFDKNLNYNPNDPTSNRYNIGDPLPTLKTNTPQYTAGGLSLLKLSKPLFNTPFISSEDPLAKAKTDLAAGSNFVPRGTIKPLPGSEGLLTPAINSLNNGGDISKVFPNAVINKPEVTPAPVITPTPENQNPVTPVAPITPTPTGKSFYRENGSLFDATTGQKILNQEQITAGGYNAEVAKPSTITPETTGGATTPANADEIQNILKLAGDAGLTPTEAMTMVDNYNALTTTDREKIKTELGISGTVAGAYKVPEQTTMDYYTKGYAASDAPIIKKDVADLDATIAKRRADLATETESLQNNPWLSQASRTGRLGILNDKATNDINNLLAQRQQKIDQYDKTITALESDVTRYAGQLETDRTINANKLNYLLNEAEKQAGTLTTDKKISNLKYLPSYLTAKATNNNQKTAYEMEKARLENLKLAQETGQAGLTVNTDNSYSDLSQGVVGGYDISSYATDPNHEKAVQSILTNIGKFNNVGEIDSYIKRKYPNSPVTGQMIANAAGKYGVSWEMMTAMMEQDSSMGTAGKGARSFNPGNVGNDDSGNIRNYGNWQAGVNAVGEWLSKHKSSSALSAATNTTATSDPYATFKNGLTANGVAQFNKLNDIDKGNVALLINGDALASDIAKGMGGAKYAQTLLAAATKVDPNYSENTNKQRYTYKAQFNNPNGKEQLQINSINTALGHLAEFNADASALGNKILLPYNQLSNYLKKNTGDPDVAKLNTVITALSGELASVYKGGTAPTDQETEQWRNTILASFSKQQTTGVAGTAANLISAKLKALNSSYKNIMGAYPENSIIDSNALSALKESGVDTSAIEQTIGLQTNYVKGQSYNFGDGSTHVYLGNNQFSD